MENYDLCLAWNTEWDVDFVELLDSALRAQGLSPLFQITPANLEHVVRELQSGELCFRAYVDRAVGDDPNFMPVVTWAGDNGAYLINPYERARHSWDKAATHLDVYANLHTPYTIILPPYQQQPELGELDLSPLGPTITTKPAHGGGGEGVIELCTTPEQVQEARRQQPDDSYLLQARVVPSQIGGRDAWFRTIYSAGHSYPCWWNTKSHAYVPVTVAETSHYGLEPIQEITQRIAEICGLQLFSNEIALTRDHEFLVVDYVNDPIDLTLQSKRKDGVPDAIVRFIAEDVAGLVRANVRQE